MFMYVYLKIKYKRYWFIKYELIHISYLNRLFKSQHQHLYKFLRRLLLSRSHTPKKAMREK